MEVHDDLVLRLSTPKDLPYIKKLSKEESLALGWIPQSMYERVWAGTFSGWITLCEVRGDPVGFCFAAPAYKPSTRTPPFYGRIYQLAVQADARRYEYGMFLADNAYERVVQAGGNGITLRCACELPANDFWAVLGWRIVEVIEVGSRVGDSPRKTRRPLYRRVKDVQDKEEVFAARLPGLVVGTVPTPIDLKEAVHNDVWMRRSTN
jgi:GNAT superfamily N-acetyltransferase